MTRIIAGEWGGRRLTVPDGTGTRPTSDRVREALFSALESRVVLAGARFADLYAGSGAIGLEALSRGAGHALLVESDPRAARTVRANLATLGAARRAELRIDRAERVLTAPPAQPYHVVVADPPYSLPDDRVDEMLTALVTGGWLAEEAVVVVERPRRGTPIGWVSGIIDDGVRRYGESVLWYGRRS